MNPFGWEKKQYGTQDLIHTIAAKISPEFLGDIANTLTLAYKVA